MTRDVLSVLLSAALLGAYTPAAFAETGSDLNFKVYSPDPNNTVDPASEDKAVSEAAASDHNKDAATDAATVDTTRPTDTPAADIDPKPTTAESSTPADTTPSVPAPVEATPAPATAVDSTPASTATTPAAATQATASTPDASNAAAAAADDTASPAQAPAADNKAADSPPAADATATNAAGSQKLKAETPELAPTTAQPAAAGEIKSAFDTTPAAKDATDTTASDASSPTVKTTAAESSAATGAIPDTPANAGAVPDSSAPPATSSEPAAESDKKVLQGYVREVPVGTKIPIIMDTAIDSDTSQEGDEFEARTSEDLDIDGQIAVPAGSVIKGRIAQLNAPRRLERNGSVALKFDTITTPDNRQIPLVANLVAHGGVVHARRGMKDIAMDVGALGLPAAAGLAIGAIAGNANKSNLGVAGGAMIGAAVGIAVGVTVVLAKRGARIDVRPGDELKIELAEALRMPPSSM